MCVKHHDGFREACAGQQQGIQPSVLLKLIQSSERGNDVLLGLPVFPAVFDDLQIDTLAGFLLPEKHGDLLPLLVSP